MTPQEHDDLMYRSGYHSMWARCACCGHEGYRWDNGFCGECQYDDHAVCLERHRRIRRSPAADSRGSGSH